MKLSRELKIAINAVQKASCFCRYVLKNQVKIDTFFKDDDSPVTIADFGSAIIIVNEILYNFSYPIIISEENLSSLNCNQCIEFKKKLFHLIQKVYPSFTLESFENALNYKNPYSQVHSKKWVVDPIDGTKGFINDRQYAIALSIIENSEVTKGVVACPKIFLITEQQDINRHEGLIYFAEKEGGAYCCDLDVSAFNKINVDSVSDTKKVKYIESFENEHALIQLHLDIASGLGINQKAIKSDSQCKYTLLAQGDISIYLRLPKKPGHREYIWDHAAGKIILEEAGGKVTDIFGNDLKFLHSNKLAQNIGIIATNSVVHNKVVSISQKIMKSKYDDFLK